LLIGTHAFVAMATLKLGWLAVRTLAKPVIKRIQTRCEESESFANSCAWLAQKQHSWRHTLQVMLAVDRLGAWHPLARKQALTHQPLDKEDAVAVPHDPCTHPSSTQEAPGFWACSQTVYRRGGVVLGIVFCVPARVVNGGRKYVHPGWRVIQAGAFSGWRQPGWRAVGLCRWRRCARG
jgi:hypothetical protein